MDGSETSGVSEKSKAPILYSHTIFIRMKFVDSCTAGSFASLFLRKNRALGLGEGKPKMNHSTCAGPLVCSKGGANPYATLSKASELEEAFDER